MKKILTLTIAALFIISLLPFSSLASFSEDLDIEIKEVFANVSFSNKTDEEIFEEKMEAFSLSDKMLDMIKKQAFDAVVASSSITATNSYFIESNSSLIQTDRNTYKNRVETVKAEKEQVFNTLQNLDLNYRTLATSSTTPTSPDVTYSVDSGTLNMTIMLITSDNINYTCLGVFQWETMPSVRNTDAFGLTRGDNLSINGNSVSASVTTYYRTVTVIGLDNEIANLHEDINYDYEDLEFSDDGKSYAIEFDIKEDFEVEYSFLYTTNYFYDEQLGCISYDGMIGLDNIVSANHFAVYAHKVRTLTFTSIDFSISFPASFTLGGFKVENTYIQRSTNHIWIR